MICSNATRKEMGTSDQVEDQRRSDLLVPFQQWQTSIRLPALCLFKVKQHSTQEKQLWNIREYMIFFFFSLMERQQLCEHRQILSWKYFLALCNSRSVCTVMLLSSSPSKTPFLIWVWIFKPIYTKLSYKKEQPLVHKRQQSRQKKLSWTPI